MDYWHIDNVYVYDEMPEDHYDVFNVFRDGEMIAEGSINSLKRHKDDAREVKDGLECGIGVDGIKKFEEGDFIEVYEIREVKRKLETN